MKDNNKFKEPILVDDNEKLEANNAFYNLEKKQFELDLCDDINSKNIPKILEEIELQIDRLKRKWNEFTYLIGQRLKYINKNKLYHEKGYKSFSTYVNVALKMSENNAYYYIAVFDYFSEEQTLIAGSKLKLIIPILNKIKKDSEISEEIKQKRINDLKNELFIKISNRTYREAEKIIKDLRSKYFTDIDEIKSFKRIILKNDKIIIYEDNLDIQNRLVDLIEQFYS